MGWFRWSYQLFALQLLLLHSLSSAKLCSHEQSSALLQFKQIFVLKEEPFSSCHGIPKMMSWNRSTDCCSWDAVTCEVATGNVIGLDLSCGWLYGSIDSNTSLFDLLHLQSLNLAFNDFNHSQISAGFSHFLNLMHLNLSDSNFRGVIPHEIARLSKLASLDLSGNSQLTFETSVVQPLVQNMTMLEVLSLDSVDMSTVAPDSFKYLSSSLTSLSLYGCGMQGHFPENIFRLPNLRMIDLGQNTNLTGVFPMANWSSHLRYLRISETSFSGVLPDSICNLKFLRDLRLDQNNFSGSLPASLGNLTQLAVLDLSNNNFSGLIPSSLSNLFQLTGIDLSSNSFVGDIPDIVNLTQLSVLSFSYNQLTGPIPSNGSKLHNLTFFSVHGNSLSGIIPSWLFHLPLLHSLYLSSNQLTGHIDKFPSNSLERLYLSNNRLNGSIPSSIFELANLTELRLSSNNFSGIIEPSMIAKLINLKTLFLSHNNLSLGTTLEVNSPFPQLTQLSLSSCNINAFPNFIRTLVGLEILEISDNNMEGQIPIWMWETGIDSLFHIDLSHNFLTEMKQIPWKRLEYLDLRSNLIQGPLPVLPPDLIALSISDNQFTGDLIQSICLMGKLEVLDLSNNNFSGTIPECMGNVSQLSVLDLRNNRLSGTIPDTFAEGNKLRTLNFNDNALEGPVPRSLVDCLRLEVLDIGNNKINDTFPYWLGYLPKLQVLILRSNKFHGSLRGFDVKQSFPKLRIIDLSHNHFSGSLPARSFINLNAMRDLGETDDDLRYMGNILYQDSAVVTLKGSEIELPKILIFFTTIDFSSNDFQGEIPGVIGELHSLRLLNLSHNHLKGRIPLSMGNLRELESLDLSSNSLAGKIPLQLTSLPSLSVLNLSHNQLEGPIPQGSQFNTFRNNSYIGNLGLCGFPLTEQCGNGDAWEPMPSTSGWFNWKAVTMGYASGLVIGLSIGYIVFAEARPRWFLEMSLRKHSKKVIRRGRGRRN